jgi:hypothetical protein
MKRLLKDDFNELRNNTVLLRGARVSVLHAFPDVYGDLRLLRFLRKDAIQSPVLAADRYQKFLRWRRDTRADIIRAMVEENEHRHPPDHFSRISENVPSTFNLLDVVLPEPGCFPIILHVGKWKTHIIGDLVRKEEIVLDEFLEYWTFMFESLHHDLYLESHRRQKLVYVDEICDLSQISLRQLASPTFVARVLEPWIKLSQSYYPETTRCIVFLNPPRILSLAWNTVARFISPGTLAKVKVISGFKGSSIDYVKHLYQ